MQRVMLREYPSVELQLIKIACVFASIEHWYMTFFLVQQRVGEVDATRRQGLSEDPQATAAAGIDNNLGPGPAASEMGDTSMEDQNGRSSMHAFAALSSALAVLSRLCACQELHASKAIPAQHQTVQEQINSPQKGVALLPSSQPPEASRAGRDSCNRVLALEPDEVASSQNRDAQRRKHNFSLLLSNVFYPEEVESVAETRPLHPDHVSTPAQARVASLRLSPLVHSSIFELLSRLCVEKRNGQRIVTQMPGVLDAVMGCLTVDLGGYAKEQQQHLPGSRPPLSKPQEPQLSKHASMLRQEMATLLVASLSRGNPEAQTLVDKGILRMLSRLVRAAEAPRPSAECELDIGLASGTTKNYAQLAIGYLAVRKNRRMAPTRQRDRCGHGRGQGPPPCIPPGLHGKVSKFPKVPMPPPRNPRPPDAPPPANVKYAKGMEPLEPKQRDPNKRMQGSSRDEIQLATPTTLKTTTTNPGNGAIKEKEDASVIGSGTNLSNTAQILKGLQPHHESISGSEDQQTKGGVQLPTEQNLMSGGNKAKGKKKKPISNVCSCM